MWISKPLILDLLLSHMSHSTQNLYSVLPPIISLMQSRIARITSKTSGWSLVTLIMVMNYDNYNTTLGCRDGVVNIVMRQGTACVAVSRILDC